MTKFAKFDRKNLTALRAEMQALLSKYGVDSNLEIEVEIKVKAKVAGAKTLTNVLLETRAAALGLKLTNKFGDQLVDYNTRAYKMPFVYINAADGKRYKCDERTAKVRFVA